MRTARPALLACALAAAAAAPAPAAGSAEQVTIELSNFDYSPSTIRLRSGAPLLLRLVNRSSGGHNFAAASFFAAARVDPASAPLVRRGAVEVRGRSSVEIRLVPARGRYRLRCTHLLHSTFGMTGEILVE